MVPHSASPPPREPRPLPPETTTALRAVIAAHWRAVSGAESALATAIRQVAVDARELGLQPEELIVALKQIEQDVLGPADALRAGDVEARRRFREWLVSSSVRAYFAPDVG